MRFALVSILLACAVAMVSTTRASAGPVATISSAPAPPQTITATLIHVAPHTLRPGTVVSSHTLGRRVFVDSQHGFALADTGQAQYPAATVNGGRTWRVSGPVLHENAAQAPLVVTEVGAMSRRVYFAAGAGEVVDATADGGSYWYRAFFPGGLLGVLPSNGRLVAVAETFATPPATTLIYVSTDGGRHWHYEPNL